MGAPGRNRSFEPIGRREQAMAGGREIAARPIPDRLLLELARLVAGFLDFALRMFQFRERRGGLGEERPCRRRRPRRQEGRQQHSGQRRMDARRMQRQP